MTTEAITLFEHDPATAKVRDFLTNMLGNAPIPARFGVYHIRNARLGNLLRTFPCIDSKDDSSRWALGTASEIVKQSHEDADTLGGTIQAYAVVAEDIKQKQIGRIVYRIHVEGDAENMGTESPDEQGMLAMSMRHTEGLTRVLVQNVSRQQQGMLQQIERLEKENERLHLTIAKRDETRMAIFALQEELLSAGVERETAREIGKIKAKVMERGGDAFMKLFPHAINHMVGKTVLPTEEGPMQNLAKAIVDGTDEKAYEKIMAAMGPNLGALFMSLLKRAGGFDDDKATKPKNGHSDDKTESKKDTPKPGDA